jgi:hypothetical protein
MPRVKTLLLLLLVTPAFVACGGAVVGPASSSAASVGPPPPADTTTPSVPGNFTAATPGGNVVNLSWSASSDNIGVTSYIVRRNGNQVGVSAVTSYADTGLSAGQIYTYTVAARDAAGNVSPNSPGRSVTIPTDTIPPSVPPGLVATPGANAISLTWVASTDNVGVTGYAVFRNGNRIGTTTTNTSYIDSCLSSNTSFTYTISAFDAAGNTSTQTAGVAATTLVSGTSSPLALLAASLPHGQWAPFVMGGLVPSLLDASTPGSLIIMFYSARGLWDCGHRKLQYAGTSHTGGAYVPGAGGLITWDDPTNQWTRETYTWSSEDPGHSYYHVALNTGNGDLYFRKFNSGAIYRRAYGSTGQSSWQSGQIAAQPQMANQVAGGLEWFPELNGGAGGLVFVDQLGAAWSNPALSGWTVQSGSSVSGPYNNWIAHAGGFVYWGGGNGSTAMYRLSPTGSVTPMPSTPLMVGNNTNDVDTNQAIILTHPNGSDLLLFGTASGGAIYQFDGTSWTNVGNHLLGPQYWIGFTVPDYGVIVFLQTNLTGSIASAMVYKP